MEKTIFLNDQKFEVLNYEEDSFINDSTDNELRKISFEVQVSGEENSKKLRDILKDSFDVQVSENSIYKMKQDNLSYSYSTDKSDLFTYFIVAKEIDPDDNKMNEPKMEKIIASTVLESINNTIALRTLVDLLSEKNIIEKEDFIQKVEERSKKEKDQLASLIIYDKDERVSQIEKVVKHNEYLVEKNEGSTEKCIGFDADEMFIIDPTYDETGIKKVDPVEYYGEEKIQEFLQLGKEKNII